MKTKASIPNRIVLIICAVIIAFPMLFTVLQSLMGPDEILRYYAGINEAGNHTMLHLLPDAPTLDAYYQILLRRPDYLVKFWNSLLLSGVITLGQVVVCCMAGYGFSRFSFLGSRLLFRLVIVLMLMPLQVTLVANFLVVDGLGLTGSYAAVALPAIFSAFGVFLMKQAFDSIDHETLQAAQLDGANQWQVLFRVALPASKSAVGTLVILGFVNAWNMVEQPLIFLNDRAKYPLSLFLAQAGSDNLALSFSCGVLALMPVLLLFLFFEQELVDGISLSSVK